MYIRFFLIVLVCCFNLVSVKLEGQEFNAEVKINTPKLKTVDPKIFKTLEGVLKQFFSERKWSDLLLKPEERINLTISLTIDEELSPTRFSAQLSIQATRPVFNSTYYTPIFQNLDKEFIFDYQEFEQLDYSENRISSNLTAMVAYYCYVVLGLDADTFSEMGGDPYFQKAQLIVNMVNQSGFASYKGWGQTGSIRNRYWLIENLLNVRMRDFRKGSYMYHLGGLDIMVDDPNKAQIQVKNALKEVQKANVAYVNTMIVQLFCFAKRDEISKIFSVSDMKTRQEIFDIMTSLDGTQVELYRKNLLNTP